MSIMGLGSTGIMPPKDPPGAKRVTRKKVRKIYYQCRTGESMEGFYKEIQEIVEELRQGSQNYHAMENKLIKAGMSESDVVKMVNTLIDQVENE